MNFPEVIFSSPGGRGLNGRRGLFDFYETITTNALTFSSGAVLNT
jgi:hypothetical protein